MPAASIRSLIVLLLCTQSACSLHYIDSAGEDRYIGWVSIRSQATDYTLSTTVQSVGLNLDLTPAGAGLNIGYRSLTTARIPPNGLIAFEQEADRPLSVTDYRSSPPTPLTNACAMQVPQFTPPALPSGFSAVFSSGKTE
ncbi:hypothetical protein I9018_11500 [Pseudomonas sp. MPFS]|uniref:hypothetical protein n=1 Tax=Pseudomonas sp. MPFS TaxID=2795724 RepID=UPI001F146293|nr:hypothetical protein [Pseudomonas sp. MPFS]UMZ14265.1 hypothetical protein I9018_11500 [Pseudomonas sp. MPFS]